MEIAGVSDHKAAMVSEAAQSQNKSSTAPAPSSLPCPDLIASYNSTSTALTLCTPPRAPQGDVHNRRSTVHAQAAVMPANELFHPLAHVRYKSPVQSMTTLVGLRQHIAHYLHLYKTELAIIAIIFIDVLAVCCEIMLESVCPHQKDVSYWKKDFNATYAQYDKDYHVLHDWETALGWISKAILFMFLVKEALLIFAVGVKNYFTKGPHLIDFFITIVAFSLEMGFFLSKQYSNSTQAATLTHLITVLLIWRVIRLLHGMMETTMAVQNHDAALDEKQQLELKYSQAKMMVANLQERVRALEVTARFQDAPGSKHMTWSRQALSQVQLAFERSSHAVLRVSASVKETDVHSSIAEASAGAQVRAEGSDHHVLFASDYFCTWLTTDPDAKHLGVQYRAHALNCGMALMEHKVTLIVVG